LAIDFGTSNTVAALRQPDGRVHDVLFDGSPMLPSAVYAGPDGDLLTGRDALHSARLAPERFEPNPKLRVDDGTVLLGTELPVPSVVAAVLGRVAGEARRIAAGAPIRAVLTHPAGWAAQRCGVLTEAAGRAGLTEVSLLPEPVAAARYFQAHHPPAGGAVPVVVYDLGGGTLDVAVVLGDRVLACEGLPDVGGLDIDAGLLHRLAGHTGTAESWQAVLDPHTSQARRTLRQLQDDVRDAKEMLSRTAQSFIHLPFLDQDAPLNREQVEAVAAPLLARTVACTRAALAAAGSTIPPPGPVYLVGGATRMPLVATMLHRELRVAPTVAEQPELVVAHGALLDTEPASPPLRPHHTEPPEPRAVDRTDPSGPPRVDPPGGPDRDRASADPNPAAQTAAAETTPRVIATKLANAERQHSSGRAGGWVGGRATLTTAFIAFHSNLMNRMVGEIVDFEFPLSTVTGVEVRPGFVTRIIEIRTAGQVARIRCYGADAFAARIRAQLGTASPDMPS
jgi:hypothetical protein